MRAGPGDLKARFGAAGLNAFAVEGVAEPGSGSAILVGGHIMRDMEGFKPYAAAVPATVLSHRGRFLARGGTVTPIAGSFVPERVVITEYPDLETALAWYTSDAYAPLLKIRLATTEARLVIMARSGELACADAGRGRGVPPPAVLTVAVAFSESPITLRNAALARWSDTFFRERHDVHGCR